MRLQRCFCRWAQTCSNQSRSASCVCATVSCLSPQLAHAKTLILLKLDVWRAVKPAIWWCTGRGKASVLWLMVGYVYFKFLFVILQRVWKQGVGWACCLPDFISVILCSHFPPLGMTHAWMLLTQAVAVYGMNSWHTNLDYFPTITAF